MAGRRDLKVVEKKAVKTVGITGIDGLIGWHLRCRLFSESDAYRVIPADRSTFESEERLDEFVEQCEVIVHLAGMNRGDPEELERTNIALAETLVSAFERTGRQPHLVFSSSTHADGETPYGRSKRKASEIFALWGGRTGGSLANLILPHVFGECGRPFYNSVVSTFCHQVANGQEPVIDNDGQLELLHAQDVAALVLQVIEEEKSGDIRTHGRRVLVSEMLECLRRIAGSYREGVIPKLGDTFNLRLFNTYRSYLFPDYYPVALKLSTDSRGALFEAVKSDHGGQAFMSTTRPGVTRGDHFHFAKVERFLVIHGEALIRIRRLFRDHVEEFRVSGETPVFIDMPTLHTHNITNTGEGELLTLFWSHEIFDPDNPDTYHEPVVDGRTAQ